MVDHHNKHYASDYDAWERKVQGEYRLSQFLLRFKFIAYDTGLLDYTRLYLEFAIGGEGTGIFRGLSTPSRGLSLVKGYGSGRGVKVYTKSNLQLGQEMHRAYKLNLHEPAKGLFKEFRLPSSKRIDFLDVQNGIIYELKPYNPRAMKGGLKQLEGYLNELKSMEQFKGINWRTVLDTY